MRSHTISSVCIKADMWIGASHSVYSFIYFKMQYYGKRGTKNEYEKRKQELQHLYADWLNNGRTLTIKQIVNHFGLNESSAHRLLRNAGLNLRHMQKLVSAKRNEIQGSDGKVKKAVQRKTPTKVEYVTKVAKMAQLFEQHWASHKMLSRKFVKDYFHMSSMSAVAKLIRRAGVKLRVLTQHVKQSRMLKPLKIRIFTKMQENGQLEFKKRKRLYTTSKLRNAELRKLYDEYASKGQILSQRCVAQHFKIKKSTAASLIRRTGIKLSSLRDGINRKMDETILELRNSHPSWTLNKIAQMSKSYFDRVKSVISAAEKDK